MKNFLNHSFDSDSPDLVSVIDELPFWSAPFGMKLLEKVRMQSPLRFLDVGCGLGFPLVELAQRLGNTSQGYGLDPWKPALQRIELKIKVYGFKNINLVNGFAEELPFEDGYFDLIISNNGLNNVANLQKSLLECGRTAKPGAQFLNTFNLAGSMIEFYSAFEEVLSERGLTREIKKMKEHIYNKRRPVEEVAKLSEEAGFKVKEVEYSEFKLSFYDAEAMFNHSFIKYWFLGAWKEILRPEDLEIVFDGIEKKLNAAARVNNGLNLSIPFAVIDCVKQ